MKWLAFLTIVPMAILVACGSDSDSADQPTETASGAITITDMLGRVVTFDQSPTRIVTVSPTSTEILYAVGGTAVGRDSSSTYPPEIESVTTVGGAYTPSYETIAGLQPELVLLEALTQGHLVDSFAATGAKVVAVRAASQEDITRSISLVSLLIDREDAGAALVTEIEESTDQARAAVTGSHSFLVLISDADRNIYAAKPESYPGAVASVLNLENLAAGMPEGGPFPGFALVPAESLISLDPDFLFTITPAPPPAPRLSESLPRIPGVGGMSAIRNGNLHELDTAIFLSAQGPRFTEAVDRLAELVGP